MLFTITGMATRGGVPFTVQHQCPEALLGDSRKTPRVVFTDAVGSLVFWEPLGLCSAGRQRTSMSDRAWGDFETADQVYETVIVGVEWPVAAVA